MINVAEGPNANTGGDHPEEDQADGHYCAFQKTPLHVRGHYDLGQRACKLGRYVNSFQDMICKLPRQQDTSKLEVWAGCLGGILKGVQNVPLTKAESAMELE